MRHPIIEFSSLRWVIELWLRDSILLRLGSRACKSGQPSQTTRATLVTYEQIEGSRVQVVQSTIDFQRSAALLAIHDADVAGDVAGWPVAW